MNGLLATVLGGIGTIVIAYWLISHSQGAFTIGTGGAKAYGNIARTFTKGTGAP